MSMGRVRISQDPKWVQGASLPPGRGGARLAAAQYKHMAQKYNRKPHKALHNPIGFVSRDPESPPKFGMGGG